MLHDGRIAESGTHDELMAAAGRYAELFTLRHHATGQSCIRGATTKLSVLDLILPS